MTNKQKEELSLLLLLLLLLFLNVTNSYSCFYVLYTSFNCSKGEQVEETQKLKR